MTSEVLRAKLHRTSITGADVACAGSITLDSDLMACAHMLEEWSRSFSPTVFTDGRTNQLRP